MSKFNCWPSTKTIAFENYAHIFYLHPLANHSHSIYWRISLYLKPHKRAPYASSATMSSLYLCLSLSSLDMLSATHICFNFSSMTLFSFLFAFLSWTIVRVSYSICSLKERWFPQDFFFHFLFVSFLGSYQFKSHILLSMWITILILSLASHSPETSHKNSVLAFRPFKLNLSSTGCIAFSS